MGVSRFLGGLLSRSPKSNDSASGGSPRATPKKLEKLAQAAERSDGTRPASDVSAEGATNGHAAGGRVSADRKPTRRRRRVSVGGEQWAGNTMETDWFADDEPDPAPGQTEEPKAPEVRPVPPSQQRGRRSSGSRWQEEMGRVRKISVGGAGERKRTGDLIVTRNVTDRSAPDGHQAAKTGRPMSLPMRVRFGARSIKRNQERRWSQNSEGADPLVENFKGLRLPGSKYADIRLRSGKEEDPMLNQGDRGPVESGPSGSEQHDHDSPEKFADANASTRAADDTLGKSTELDDKDELADRLEDEPVSRFFRNLDRDRPLPLFHNNRESLRKLRPVKIDSKPKSSLDKVRPPPLVLKDSINRSVSHTPNQPPAIRPHNAVRSSLRPLVAVQGSGGNHLPGVGGPVREQDDHAWAAEPAIVPLPVSPTGEICEHQFVFGGQTVFDDTKFAVGNNGAMLAPDDLHRKDSDGSSVEGVPKSTHRIITVDSLHDFRKGPDLGAGYAGSVYLAVHEPTGQKMAVKVVNVIDADKRKQLLKELETLTTFVSRFLVRSYGAFFDRNGAVRIALEYMDRGSLCDAIKALGPVPEEVINQIAVHCLRGLNFLHKNRILHRDLKTANILLSRRLKRAKLSDFGLAREVNPGVSNANTFVGTLAYMSPERLEGGAYTYASDIWGLGISLTECILGRYPFPNPQTFFDFLKAVKTNPHTLIGSMCSKELVDFVKICTYRDPKMRPTAKQLLRHPWITENIRNGWDFVDWLDRIPEVKGTSKGRGITVRRS